MRLSMVPVLVALLANCGTYAWSEDQGPIIEPAEAQVATPVLEVAEAAISDLTALLPVNDDIVADGERILWDNHNGTAYHILSVDAKAGTVTVETEIGPLPIPRIMLEQQRRDALEALPQLIATAQADSLRADSGMSLAEGIMTGLHLRSADILVLREGVVKKIAADPGDRTTEIATLERAIEDVRRTFDRSDLDPLARKAVEDILTRLPLSNTARKFDFDEVLPDFARRVVRSGWMRGLTPDKPLAEKVEQAIIACETMKSSTAFIGKGLRLAEVKNAFDQGGWILETPTRTAFAHSHPAPMYAWGAERWNLLLVAELPAGSDPLKDGAKTERATLFQGARQIATWSQQDGFVCDTDVWRSIIPDHGKHVGKDTLSNYLPPHLVISDLDGDVHLLATTSGAVVPPRNASTPEAERFLNDAAKALPDPAHLDLVGEYLFYYVYDSPDSRYPQVIGNKQIKGDIHQTAFQSLATVANGICRGDCDDLSELYQEILERQGRTAHVITLPRHAACAVAELIEAQWHVYILQTGQPLEFIADKLPDALRLAYLSFDDSDNFDPNGLGLLLRFTGENTRGSWRLSWRIFSEPDYAMTMIDVQKDWHFSTYQRGIHKMKDLIAAGDNDTANYRELSGLYSFTGQHALSVENHRKALELTEDPESHLYAAVELVNHLFDAGDEAAGRAEAEQILNDDLPKLRAEMGQRAVQFGFQLASVCASGKAYDLAERAIADTMLKDMTDQITQVSEWLGSPQFNKRRWEGVEPLRRMLQMFVGSNLAILKGVGSQDIATDATLQTMVRATQTWLDRIAFYDVDEPDDVLARYSTAAVFYEALLGKDRFMSLLADAPLATDSKMDHTKRVGGLAQVRLDLPWIKTSPGFWYGKLAEAVNKDAKTVDPQNIINLCDAMVAAYDNCHTLDIEDPFMDSMIHQGLLVKALITQDEALLRERLRYVTARNDKRLRDDSAQWLGDVARFCSKEWYATVLQCWVDECDYKPKYFWIAWRAALSDAPERALMVAQLAAARFPDDADFQEELAYMQELFAPKAP